MKTAISLPDQVFADAERLARRLHRSRSDLYGQAIAEYVARHDPEAVTEAMNRSLEEVTDEDKELDGFVQAAAHRTLRRTEW